MDWVEGKRGRVKEGRRENEERDEERDEEREGEKGGRWDSSCYHRNTYQCCSLPSPRRIYCSPEGVHIPSEPRL